MLEIANKTYPLSTLSTDIPRGCVVAVVRCAGVVVDVGNTYASL